MIAEEETQGRGNARGEKLPVCYVIYDLWYSIPT